MKIDVLIYSIDTAEECIPRDMPMERTIKIKEFRPCCREVVKAQNVDIKFADPEDKMPTLVLINKHVDYSWGDTFDWEEYQEIKFCPFCGKPVEINVLKEIPIAQVYDALKERRDLILAKIRKTDSKSACSQMENEIKEINRKMDWYLEDSSIHDFVIYEL